MPEYALGGVIRADQASDVSQIISGCAYYIPYAMFRNHKKYNERIRTVTLDYLWDQRD